MYQSADRATFKSTPPPATPVSALQRRADASPSVAQLHALQSVADARHSAPIFQLYATETLKTQDGHFIPKMTAAIHCHIGKKMRQPHLKIRGETYNFGVGYDQRRMQAAYDALVGDPAHAALEGYADCVEYLEENGCVAAGPSGAGAGAAEAAPADDGPTSAYDDPTNSKASKRLIERGLAAGQYPPPSL